MGPKVPDETEVEVAEHVESGGGRIVELTGRAVSIPVRTRTEQSTRLLDRRDYLVVEIRCAGSEEVGVGYTYAGTRGARTILAAVEELLAPEVVGADAADVVRLWDRVYQETLMVGRRGLVVRALSAVDIALWDLAAKRAGVPLAVLLGGSTRPVPAYASGGYYRPDAGDWEDAVRAEIAGDAEQGFTDHKIKVGGLPIAQDARRVAAAVEVLGPQGQVALDCNNAYPDDAEALRAIRAFERAAGERGLWFVEEPLSCEDVAGHARLVERVDTPIATGEIHQTRWEFRRLLEERAAQIVQPDAGVLGGVTEWVRVARTAETFGVPVAPHWHANLHVHLAAATPGCLGVEHFRHDKGIYNFEDLLEPAGRLRVEGGRAIVPEAPGLGLAWDADALARYTVEDGLRRVVGGSGD